MKYLYRIFYLVAFVSLWSCVDDNFETPDPIEIPTPNATVADVLALFNPQTDVIIEDDLIFEATVISSDEAGNIFETLYVQDTSGAIALRIDANDLFNDFPYLSTVVVSVKDLELTSFNELIQLDALNETNFKRHVFLKNTASTIDIPTKSISDLTFDDVPSIVRLEGIEFAASELGGNFGDDSGLTGLNRTLQDCDGGTIITRISNFSDFQNTPISMGGGDGTFVVSRFGSTLQLLFGTLDDLNLDEERCPEQEANATIADLKNLYGGFERVIDEELFIEATVVSSDETGNIFRTLYVQDETGGLTLSFDNVQDLFQFYPYFSKILIKAENLILTEDNDLLVLTGLGESNFNTALTLRSPNSDLQIETKRITELSFDDVPRLVRLEGVQFSNSDLGGGFGNDDSFGVNRTIEDCDGNEIICRISNFSDFQRDPIASGNGDGLFILSRFRDDLQLVFNDPSFLSLNNERCGSAACENIVSIKSLRDSWANGNADISDGSCIVGEVISDFENGNLTGRNLVIQDESGSGIVLRFTDNHPYTLGSEIQVSIGGSTMSEFQGGLQIDGLGLGAAIPQSGMISITPRVLTVSEILGDFENLESSLIRLNNVALSGGSSFGGALTVTDATGSITLFTRNAATFAGSSAPSGSADLIAYVSQGGGNMEEMQIQIRNLNDVIADAPDAIDEFFEDFQTAADREDISMNGWSTITAEGDRSWWGRSFDDNFYAQATAFNANSNEIETWMFSPEFNHDVDKTLRFETAQAFYNHDGLSVWISTDYDGSNFSSATFTPITGATIAGSSSNDNDWIDSGEIVLSATGGTAYIAFRYEGNPNNATTSYRVDNVSLMNR